MTIEEMKERKRELGYTSEQLARISGVPLGTVQKIFAGVTKSPRQETILALHRALWPGETWLFERETKREALHLNQEDVDSIYEAGESLNTWQVREAVSDYKVKREGIHTTAEYYALPDGKRMELIDGVFYDLAAPSLTHQRISKEIFLQLHKFVESRNGDCEVFFAPVDVRVDGDDYSMIQPDVFVVCDTNKITGQSIEGAPDLVIEITSPSNAKHDYVRKYYKYASSGVREYWIVDEKKERVFVYQFQTADDSDFEVSVYTFRDMIPVGVFAGECEIDFNRITDKLKNL